MSDKSRALTDLENTISELSVRERALVEEVEAAAANMAGKVSEWAAVEEEARRREEEVRRREEEVDEELAGMAQKLAGKEEECRVMWKRLSAAKEEVGEKEAEAVAREVCLFV